jgi:hypothetical protein
MNLKLLLTFMVLLISMEVHAYSYWTVGNGNPIRWHESGHIFKLASSSFSPPTGTVWRAQFDHAIGQWNNQNHFYQYSTQLGDCSPTNFLDDCNSVTFISDGCDGNLLSNPYLGAAFPRFSVPQGKLKSVDIWFDVDCSWIPNEHYRSFTNERSFLHVSLHELGHSLHLYHTDITPSIMGPGEHQDYLQYDDIAGVNFLYPSTINRDLFVSEVNILSTQYTDSNATTRIDVEYTIGHFGQSAANNIDVNFSIIHPQYGELSHIGTSRFNMPAGSVGTFQKTFYVPAYSIIHGEYKLQVVIDKEHQVYELNEMNNFASPNIQLGPPIQAPEIAPLQLTFFQTTDTTLLPTQAAYFYAQICNVSTETIQSINFYIESTSGFILPIEEWGDMDFEILWLNTLGFNENQQIIAQLDPGDCGNQYTYLVTSSNAPIGTTATITGLAHGFTDGEVMNSNTMNIDVTVVAPGSLNPMQGIGTPNYEHQ